MAQSNEQNYQNHRKISNLFYVVLAPLALILLTGSLVHMIREGFTFPSILLFGFAVFAIILAAFLRPLLIMLQNRIIRNEERTRHYILTGKPLDANLTLGQIIALRFSSDSQFPALCKQAAENNMKPDAIKRAVTNWRADHLRV